MENFHTPDLKLLQADSGIQKRTGSFTLQRVIDGGISSTCILHNYPAILKPGEGLDIQQGRAGLMN